MEQHQKDVYEMTAAHAEPESIQPSQPLAVVLPVSSNNYVTDEIIGATLAAAAEQQQQQGGVDLGSPHLYDELEYQMQKQLAEEQAAEGARTTELPFGRAQPRVDRIITNATGRIVPVCQMPNYREFRLFPELYNEEPVFPSFAEIFKQTMENAAADAAADAQAAEDAPQQTEAAAAANAAPAEPSEAATEANSSDAGAQPPIEDDRGLTGLANIMRASMINSESTELSLGIDLTKMGLDLASDGDIYVNFNGPFTVEPPPTSSISHGIELGMRGLREVIRHFNPPPPVWEPFVHETGNLGLHWGPNDHKLPFFSPPAEERAKADSQGAKEAGEEQQDDAS